ncbi:MAG TPA: site-specific DNA-methyltransferase [Streptosporangiaceae bacterium]|nr:site-specific DNA-methyltransferase [Streptosporangiaceae bacterium]
MSADVAKVDAMRLHEPPSAVPPPPTAPEEALRQLLAEGVTWGDSADWLPALPEGEVDLFFTSPPYADARAYSRIHPDRYVEWFMPFARAMFEATAETGSLVLNIKNRVAKSGELRGQRHPYVYQLVLAMQEVGWRWLETYIWAKPNAVPGRYGPRTKDSFEYVYHFARGPKPYFNLDAVRVPYKTTTAEIERRMLDSNGRRNTEAGFGRDRTTTYLHEGADPGNVLNVPQTYNQHYGVAHTAAMPEGLASFFVKAVSPQSGVVIDPFAGGGTTTVVARRLGRQAGGIEVHRAFVDEASRRIGSDEADEPPGRLVNVAVSQ